MKIIKLKIVLFIIIIFIVPIYFICLPAKDFSENENRYLSQFPSFNLENVISKKFMEDLTSYYSDQMPLREKFISLKTNIELKSGKTMINNVYISKDDYLIENWNINDFDEKLFKDNLNILNDFGNEIKVSVMIVPTSSLILKDNLPKYAPMLDQNIIFEDIFNYLKNVKLIDIREDLLKYNDEYIYYRTDHHWTTYGAYVGYLRYVEEMELNTNVSKNKLKLVSDDFKGSIYSKILINDCLKDKIYLYQNNIDYVVEYNFGKEITNSVYNLERLNEKDKYQVFLNGNHPEIKIKTNNEGGKILIFKDSFANAFIPFLLDNYSEIYVIDLRYFNYSVQDYIKENNISECLFLYNIKNFVEDKNLSKILY